MDQEKVFVEQEADRWYQRNAKGATRPAASDHPILASLARCELPDAGSLLDVGGASGRISAGFLNSHANWRATVVEPSSEAIAAGRIAFPQISFMQGSMNETLPQPEDGKGYDLVICSGVLTWCGRRLLSRAVANIDASVADRGLLVICDFDPPFQRANAYAHEQGLWTYKQDYAACFLALGIYHVEQRQSYETESASDPKDPYDRKWGAVVMRKDLEGRYARFS